ncbi:phosphomannomutase/phosphoglucomutase [Nanoarchaeota archaeon]
MGIFKAYDIRGKYPDELDGDKAYKIGKAIATFFNVNEIVVGRDNRTSSDEIFNSVCKGLNEMGVNVLDIGVVSSPMSYFGVNHLKGKAMVMVTASHNPKEYNGFKLTREGAIPVSGVSGLKEIEDIYTKGSFKEVASEKGSIKEVDIFDDYMDHLSKFVKEIHGLKVVVDCGNGVMGPIIEGLFSRLFMEYVPMYFERDGNYPNHDPNPMIPDNLKELQAKVKEEGANLGIAFDGDGDRVVFVDEKSNSIPSDFVTCLLAMQMIKEGDIVIYDLRSSWIVKEIIDEYKGKGEETRVGHSFIKEHMRKVNALFAGELSGHYYFRDNFFTDSGIIAALKILSLVSNKGKLSELVKPMHKYHKIPETNFDVEDKDGALKRIEEKYKDCKVSHLDGIKVETDKYWFNVRKSNTESKVRLNLEAKSKIEMEKILNEVSEVIQAK